VELAYSAVAGLVVLVALALQLGRPWAVWSVPLVAVGAAVAAYSIEAVVPLAWFPLVYVVYSVSPLLVFVAYVRGWEGSRWEAFGMRVNPGRWPALIATSSGLVGVYLLLTLEPGIVLGFGASSAPLVGSFALYFLTTPLLVLGQEAVFRGLFLTKLAERFRLPTAFLLSGVAFAATTVSPWALIGIPFSSLGEIFFTTLLVSFLLGVIAAIYTYKTDWSLLGPWSFRTGLLWAALLLPIAVTTGWPTIFVFELMAFGAVLALLYAVLQEPRYQARHFLGEPLRPRRRTLIASTRARRETIRTGIGVVVVAGVLLLAAPTLFRSSSAPIRFEAIATGSMVPTFSIGTLVVVVPIASATDVHTGEIVAYNAPYLTTTGPVVHRVVAIHTVNGALEFTFKGDHNAVPDPRPVAFDQVVGRVAGSVPVLGYFVLDPLLGVSIAAALVLYAVFRSAPESPSRPARRPILPYRGEIPP
jgi:signal peptidase I